MLAWRISEDQQRRIAEHSSPAVPAGVATVLSVLRSAPWSSTRTTRCSRPPRRRTPSAWSATTPSRSRSSPSWSGRYGATGRSARPSSCCRGPDVAAIHVTARVAPLSSRLVLALVEDRTRERRVEAIRRDFVANVSHELKTPVGAINLLAEAVLEASGDPEAVERFAGRMQTERAAVPARPADHRAVPAAGRRPARGARGGQGRRDHRAGGRHLRDRRAGQADQGRARRRARARGAGQRRPDRGRGRQPGRQRDRLLPERSTVVVGARRPT